jgi:tRNA threonylcarbamoyladenosine biosynthesis protein TsaE
MTDSAKTHHITVRSHSEIETERLGFALGRRLDRGLCVCMVGSLGSGKTVMVRGICRGLGVRETVVSPSFILCEEYDGRIPVIHVDLYRLEHEREIDELGVFDRLDEAAVLAEWGDRSTRLFEMADIVVTLAVAGETERTIKMDFDAALDSVYEGLE